MTDEEIICTWIEPKLKGGPFDCRPWHSVSPLGWWVATESRRMDAPNEWYPRPLTLDALHEVEERLSDEQQWEYIEAIRKVATVRQAGTWHYLHFSAEQKIKAIAAVLRTGIRTPVEGEKP